jgi:hypothetical protein
VGSFRWSAALNSQSGAKGSGGFAAASPNPLERWNNRSVFVDTQVVSYAKKGTTTRSIKGARISSVTASELLLVYGEKRTAANYYVPAISTIHLGTASLGSTKRDHPFSRNFTDSIVFDFGRDFEPLKEFGSNTISTMVNERNIGLLRQSIAFLDKRTQKYIREDFDFLVDNDIECVPLSPNMIEAGYRYLKVFQSSGEKVKTSFRNTWNDLLILSTAEIHAEKLWSEDSQLNRIAASSFGEFAEAEPGTLDIWLRPGPLEPAKRTSRESKRYVNTGWTCIFKNGRQQAW